MSTSSKEETSHEPGAKVTWPETGSRVRTDSELLGSFQGQVRMGWWRRMVSQW